MKPQAAAPDLGEALHAFYCKLVPFFALAAISLEALDEVSRDALPMSQDVAMGMLGLRGEWQALENDLVMRDNARQLAQRAGGAR